MSEEALQIAEQRREAKSKGGRERYTQLNANLQRIPKRDKKGCFNEKCKEIEENYRRGKTRDLIKKIGNIQGIIFHPKVGTIKERNSKDLTEAEEIKKSWKDYTKLYKKILMIWMPPRCDYSPRDRYSVVRSQDGFRKNCCQ